MQFVSRRTVVLSLACLAATALASAWGSASAEQPPLAIEGYDPVSYFTLGRPERGSPGIEYDWDEHRYRFARPEHRDMFKADPARYAPQFAGYCAASLARGEITEANPEYWLISEGKLYLFGKPIGPTAWQSDTAALTAKANEHRALVQKR